METLQRTANRGSISTGYDIDNSLKFEADNTEIIYRTNESGTNRKTFTVSAWFKRTELGVDQQVWHGGTFGEAARIGISSYDVADDSLWVDVGGGTGNTGTLYRSFSTLKIRDTSAWYHFCVAVDTTQATEANRMKAWLNGVEVTDWAQHQIPAQDFQCALQFGTEMAWGGFRPSNLVLFSGYLAECHYLDGVTAVQTDFGEYDEDSGIWKPKAYAGTYGDNGCYLNFDDSASLGADSSGNGNTFTLNNISAADQATDTPTNNFAINNIIDGGVYTSDNVSYKEGGTVQIRNQNTNYNYNFSTLGMTKGKWYAEFQRGNDVNIMIGIQLQNFDSTLYNRVNVYIGSSADNHGGAFSAGGAYFYNNTASTGHTAYGTSDILGVAVDCDNNKIYFSVNGTYVNSGNPASGSNGFDFGPLETNEPCFFVMNSYGPNLEHKANFGGYTTISISSAASDESGYGTFEYAPPSGYYALCTKNLAEYG